MEIATEYKNKKRKLSQTPEEEINFLFLENGETLKSKANPGPELQTDESQDLELYNINEDLDSESTISESEAAEYKKFLELERQEKRRQEVRILRLIKFMKKKWKSAEKEKIAQLNKQIEAHYAQIVELNSNNNYLKTQLQRAESELKKSTEAVQKLRAILSSDPLNSRKESTSSKVAILDSEIAQVKTELFIKVEGEDNEEIDYEAIGEVNNELTGEMNNDLMGEENNELMGEVNNKLMGEENNELMGEVNSELMGEVGNETYEETDHDANSETVMSVDEMDDYLDGNLFLENQFDTSSAQESSSEKSFMIEKSPRLKKEKVEKTKKRGSFVNTLNKEKQIELESCIPVKFTHDLNRLIDSGISLEQKDKSLIIRETCRNMVQNGLTQSHFATAMSVLLCQKFPFLKGPLHSEHLETLEKIKNCLQNLKRNTKIRSGSSNDLHESLCAEMKYEVSRLSESNLKKVQDLLDKTRMFRQREVNKMKPAAIFLKYPAFHRSELLLWELSKVVNVPVIKLRDNWTQAIPKLATNLELSFNDDVNVNGKCVKILLNLHRVFTYSKAKLETEKIIKMCPAGTSESQIVPVSSDPPRLLAISSDSINKTSLKCYADGVCAFSANGFNSVLLLIAVYWVLNIPFPVSSKLQFSLIAVAVLRGAGAKKLDALKLSCFTKILRKLELTE